MKAEFGIAGAIAFSSGQNGLTKAVLTHASGASAEVYLHGAHVTSWKNAKGDELSFLSKNAIFELGTAIRGGIPLCFPQFGPGQLPQHGFARNRDDWQVTGSHLADDGTVSISLQLTDSRETLAAWPHPFVFAITMEMQELSLNVNLQVCNTGDASFDFQAVLHTYFGVADIRQVAVRGLQGVTYIDSLQDDVREVEEPAEIRFAAETDRIYMNTPNRLSVADEIRQRKILIEKSNMPDVVVWNPWIAKSKRMNFVDEEYLRMVCVETGNMTGTVSLAPAETWQGSTRYTEESQEE